jgi:hypothetical protein
MHFFSIHPIVNNNFHSLVFKNIQKNEKAFYDGSILIVACIVLAFAWVYKTGIYLDSIIPIKIKKHGRRARSIYKYGLNYITNMLFSKYYECSKFLSCT